jgi:hypothetical protein
MCQINSAVGPTYRFPDPKHSEVPPATLKCQGGDHYNCHRNAQLQAAEFYKHSKPAFRIRINANLFEDMMPLPNYREKVVPVSSQLPPDWLDCEKSPIPCVLHYTEQVLDGYDRLSGVNRHVRLVNKYLDMKDAGLHYDWEFLEQEQDQCHLQWIVCGERYGKARDGFRIIFRGEDGIVRQIKFARADYGGAAVGIESAREAAEICARKLDLSHNSIFTPENDSKSVTGLAVSLTTNDPL